MAYHVWGDDWFEKNGNDLYNAVHYCMDFWRKWGRIGSRGKEKWGQFNDYPTFWDGGLHTLLYPGYVRIKRPFLHYKIDWKILIPLTTWTGIHRLGLWYQYQVYNYAIQKMCKKYPNIVDELVGCLDGRELIKPGIFGKVDGRKYLPKGV